MPTKYTTQRQYRDRFISYTDKDSTTECWIWSKGRWSNGYGKFTLKGKKWRAHRASFVLFCGEITEGLHVLHTCDNPSCVNPNHLFLGTHLENMGDRDRKKRQARGELGGKTKLTLDQVNEIRARYKRGYGVSLGKEFGVTSSYICEIVRGDTWKASL